MSLNRDEEMFLWAMSKLSKRLIKYYENVLKHDRDDSWDKNTVKLLKNEKKNCEFILEELDSVLNGSAELDRSALKSLVKAERKSEEVEKKLEMLSQEGRLDMAGNKGLKYIVSLEDFTEFLTNYEQLKESSIDYSDSNVRMKSEMSTENADYICTYQKSHGKYNNFSDQLLEKTDAFVLEDAFSEPLQNIDISDFFENPVKSQRDDSSIQPAQHSLFLLKNQKLQKPVFMGDVAPKKLKGKTSEDFGRIDYVIEEIKQSPSEYVAVAGFGFPVASLLGALSVPTGVIGSVVSLTPLIAGGIANFLADRGIRLRGLTIARMLDPAAARSAIIAEKMEEFIAPEIESQKGGKPVILFNYGAGHFEIELFLKYPKLRRMTLAIHKAGNFPALEEKEVNQVLEFEFGPEKENYYRSSFNGEEFEVNYSKKVGNIDLI